MSEFVPVESPVFDVVMALDAMLSSPDGRTGRVVAVRIERGQLVLMVARGGEVEKLSLREALMEHVTAQRLASPDTRVGPPDEVLYWLTPARRAKVLQREADVCDVLWGRTTAPGRKPGPYDADTTTVTQRRRSKRLELGISNATIGRWLENYRASGVAGLVPHAERVMRKTGALDLDPEILAVARDFAAKRVKSSHKTLINEHGLFLAELQRRGLVTLGDEPIEVAGRVIPTATEAMPHDRFVAMIRHLTDGKSHRDAKTLQQQAKRPAIDGYRHRGYDFGDRIEMDSTPLDVWVRRAGGRAVKAHAVFAVCASTRYMWVRVTEGAPRGRDLALLLWDMAGGESSLIAGSPLGATSLPMVPRHDLIINAWCNEGPPPPSMAGCIVLDHGAEEENGRSTRYTGQMGGTIRWAATATPTDKAYVESSIRGMALTCQLIPGHKGNSVANRPEAEPDPSGLPTIEMLQAAVVVWQEARANLEHQGLPHPRDPSRFFTPLEAVHMSVTRGIPVHGLNDPTRALGLMEHVQLTPQSDGVVLNRRRFTCPDFSALVEHSKRKTGLRGPVTFYRDPNRPGRLYWPQPGKTEPVLLMTAEEAAEAVAPFADLREHWMAAAPGHPIRTRNQKGLTQARLAVSMQEAMDDVDRAQLGPLTLGSSRSTDEPGANADWDFSEVVHLFGDDDQGSAEEGR